MLSLMGVGGDWEGDPALSRKEKKPSSSSPKSLLPLDTNDKI